jgi:restriction endonuclease S subunit
MEEIEMYPLRQLADVFSGYPFRGKIPHTIDGDARVIQMKDVDEPNMIYWDNLVNTKLKGRRQPDWLQAGDVIFLLRGNWFFAVHIDNVPFPTVISPHFFLLRVKDQSYILPKFLAWQINQPPAQRYLNASAEGSVQARISCKYG